MTRRSKTPRPVPNRSSSGSPDASPPSRSTMNALRAAVLGADDGIVSVAGIVMGVAGASSSRTSIVIAGIAGLSAGAFSMAAGEFVSVSSQRDSERVLLAKEAKELREHPVEELEELAGIYERKGLSRATAQQVANELMAKDAFAAHLDAELHMNAGALTNPWQAAAASALSFSVGDVLPILTVMLFTAKLRLIAMVIAVILSLSLTGVLSALASGASRTRAAVRVVCGGMLAMAITYVIGRLVGGALVG